MKIRAAAGVLPTDALAFSEFSMDNVGIVMGLEMSRLARSCKDWHHLLGVCAVFGTLLADQDGPCL
jgi:hypothetical protein